MVNWPIRNLKLKKTRGLPCRRNKTVSTQRYGPERDDLVRFENKVNKEQCCLFEVGKYIQLGKDDHGVLHVDVEGINLSLCSEVREYEEEGCLLEVLEHIHIGEDYDGVLHEDVEGIYSSQSVLRYYNMKRFWFWNIFTLERTIMVFFM